MYSYVIIITPKYYGKPSTLNIIFYNKFVIVSIELNFILFAIYKISTYKNITWPIIINGKRVLSLESWVLSLESWVLSLESWVLSLNILVSYVILPLVTFLVIKKHLNFYI